MSRKSSKYWQILFRKQISANKVTNLFTPKIRQGLQFNLPFNISTIHKVTKNFTPFALSSYHHLIEKSCYPIKHIASNGRQADTISLLLSYRMDKTILKPLFESSSTCWLIVIDPDRCKPHHHHHLL